MTPGTHEVFRDASANDGAVIERALELEEGSLLHFYSSVH
jgi:hypothetical protein